MSDSQPADFRYDLVTLSARLAFGSLFLLAGAGKFIGGYSGYVGWMTDSFKDAWIPDLLLLPFVYSLPFLEVGLGVLLLAGLLTPWALFGTVLLMVAFNIGKLALKDHAAVVDHTVYITLAVIGILAAKSDRFSLDRLRKGG